MTSLAYSTMQYLTLLLWCWDLNQIESARSLQKSNQPGKKPAISSNIKTTFEFVDGKPQKLDPKNWWLLDNGTGLEIKKTLMNWGHINLKLKEWRENRTSCQSVKFIYDLHADYLQEHSLCCNMCPFREEFEFIFVFVDKQTRLHFTNERNFFFFKFLKN